MEKIKEIDLNTNDENNENDESHHDSDHNDFESIFFNDLGSINLKEAEDILVAIDEAT